MRRSAVLTIAIVWPGLTACGTADVAGSSPADAASPSPSTRHVDVDAEADTRTGALRGDAAGSCVEEYNPQTLATRAFAFDGVVVDILPGRTNGPGGGALDLRAVTFDVEEWFSGDGEDQVTVEMYAPAVAPSATRTDETTPSYELGTRLLVSGEPRWGGDPLEEGIAWGCGFTRYHDPAAAGTWREAFS